ncbi:MAG: hypothetical protein GY797_27185 [Deltaproteobacteria bacterium]|nr:hypothetical protein [Deltaproteobacteria bacterium]
MPNCDFYAVGNDIDRIFEFVFNDLDCRIFESYSPFEMDIVEFKSLDDLNRRYSLGMCKKRNYSALLQMWPINASSKVFFKRIELDPKKCNGATFRYRMNGWGLIQLYVGGISELGIIHSHTNHNSEKRAHKWAGTYDDMGSPEEWDWKEVTRISSKLNRQIRKLSVNKIGSKPILQYAEKQLSNGLNAI